MSLLSSEVIGLHLELPVEGPLNHLLFLGSPLHIDFIQSLCHLLPDLLRRFHVGKEFLLVQLILVGEERGQLAFPGVQVGCGPFLDIGDSIPGDPLYDDVLGLLLPSCLK